DRGANDERAAGSAAPHDALERERNVRLLARPRDAAVAGALDREPPAAQAQRVEPRAVDQRRVERAVEVVEAARQPGDVEAADPAAAHAERDLIVRQALLSVTLRALVGVPEVQRAAACGRRGRDDRAGAVLAAAMAARRQRMRVHPRPAAA